MSSRRLASVHNRPTRTVEELKRLLEPPSFSLPDETRFSGHWIIAPPGRGKTTLLHTLVADDLEKDAAIVLMDSKGDLIEPIKNGSPRSKTGYCSSSPTPTLRSP